MRDTENAGGGGSSACYRNEHGTHMLLLPVYMLLPPRDCDEKLLQGSLLVKDQEGIRLNSSLSCIDINWRHLRIDSQSRLEWFSNLLI